MKARDLINMLSYHPDAEIKIVPHQPDYTKESFSGTENFPKVKEYHKTKSKKVTGYSYYAPIEDTIFFYYDAW